jgi:hypothetical protein
MPLKKDHAYLLQGNVFTEDSNRDLDQLQEEE